MRGYRGVATAEDLTSTLDSLGDVLRMANRLLAHGPIHDVRLGRVREGSQIPNAVLSLLVDLDRSLWRHGKLST